MEAMEKSLTSGNPHHLGIDARALAKHAEHIELKYTEVFTQNTRLIGIINKVKDLTTKSLDARDKEIENLKAGVARLNVDNSQLANNAKHWHGRYHDLVAKVSKDGDDLKETRKRLADANRKINELTTRVKQYEYQESLRNNGTAEPTAK